jgi:hypothetical protein
LCGEAIMAFFDHYDPGGEQRSCLSPALLLLLVLIVVVEVIVKWINHIADLTLEIEILTNL